MVGCVFIIISACRKEKQEEVIDCSGVSPGFVSDVSPIINAHCLSSGCHNAGSVNGDYTSYDGLKAVAANGALENRVVINKTMPSASPLSLEERKKIKCWINSGAPEN